MVDSDGTGLVLILSTPRAGSTLLAAMLGSHSRIACPAEPWLLLPLHAITSPNSEIIAAYDHSLARVAWHDLMNEDLAIRASRSFATEVYNHLLEQEKKNVVVDKTPRYYHILPWLEKIFPKARKIWIQRDPLDIIASCKETWGFTVDEMTGTNVTPHTFDTTVSFALLASYFNQKNSTRYKLRYEDLVRDPDNQIKALCAFLGLPFEQEMLDYGANDSLMKVYTKTTMGDKKVLAHDRPHAKSIGRWQEILSPLEIERVLLTLGCDVFTSQGYHETLEGAVVRAGLTEVDLDQRGKLDQIMTLYSAYAVEGSPSPEASQHSRLARENAQLRDRLSECETDRAQRLVIITSQGQSLGEVEAERNDLRLQLNGLQQQFEAMETDRAARLQVIEEQGRHLGDIEAERDDLRFQLVDLQKHFEAAEADRAARLNLLKEQGNKLGIVEASRNELQAQLDALTEQITLIEADRTERLAVIESLGTQLGRAESERNDAQAQLADSHKHIDNLTTDYAARLVVIEEQGKQLGITGAERNEARAGLNELRSQFDIVEADRAARLRVINDLAQQVEAANITGQQLSEMNERLRQELNDLRSQRPVRALKRLRVIKDSPPSPPPHDSGLSDPPSA